MIQFLNKHYRRYKVNAIQKAHPKTKMQRKDLQSSNHIAILFDSTEENAQQVAMDFSDKLRQSSKKITLLGYIPKLKKADAQPTFSYFTKRELNNLSEVKSEALSRFLKSEFDLLIGLFRTPNIQLEHLVYRVDASFKVGHYCNDNFCFDFMIEDSGDFGLKHLALNIHKYLPKITTKTKQATLAN